jgi:pSer/pThr/pTyr-binding forkhead associated (FHA) protein
MPEQREFPLVSPTATVGRESINEIVFDDAEISRRHVRVTLLAGRYIIEDLGSTNGTFLNGRRIEAPAPLANGDVIDLGGSIRLTYLGPPGAAESTVVEPSADQLGVPETVARPTPVDELPLYKKTEPQYEAVQFEGVQYKEPLTPPPLTPAYESAPPQAPPQAPTPYTPPESEGREWTRYLIGCGCLLILAIVACAATLALLDYLAPNTLYCGPLESIFEGLGFTISCT